MVDHGSRNPRSPGLRQEGLDALATSRLVAVQADGVGDVMADGAVCAPCAESDDVVREVNEAGASVFAN